MKTKRGLAVGLLWLGFAVGAALPASAQVDVRYTGPGLAVPTINTPGPGVAGGPVGGVLAASGQRTGEQVLPAQVGGGVAGTAQAPVQGLAFTGADIFSLVTFGLVAIVLGLVMNRRARVRALPGR